MRRLGRIELLPRLLPTSASGGGLLGLFLSADLLALDLEILAELPSGALLGLESELKEQGEGTLRRWGMESYLCLYSSLS